jgi:Transglycosylase SLT domain
MPIGTISQTSPAGHPVTSAIAEASQRTGVSFDYLMAQANVESSMDPHARASTSSAAGLFQFTRQTWLATLSKHGTAHGLGWAASAISRDARGHYAISDPAIRQQVMDLRFDANASSSMAAAFADDNADMLRTQLGTEPESVDLYLAHFLGGAGAAKFLTEWRADPDAAAAPLFPKAAGANQTIFYNKNGQPRSLNDIRERFRAKLGEGATGRPGLQLAKHGPTKQAVSNPSLPVQSSSSVLAMRGFETMPGKLSLAFAERTYDRLATIGSRA